MLSDEEKAVLKTAKENYGLTSAEQKILVNLIEKQSKEIEGLKEDSCCMTNCVRRDKEKLFLEDKIKAKIEECKRIIEDLENKEEWLKPFDTITKNRNANYINILQSLLKEE